MKSAFGRGIGYDNKKKSVFSKVFNGLWLLNYKIIIDVGFNGISATSNQLISVIYGISYCFMVIFFGSFTGPDAILSEPYMAAEEVMKLEPGNVWNKKICLSIIQKTKITKSEKRRQNKQQEKMKTDKKAKKSVFIRDWKNERNRKADKCIKITNRKKSIQI